MKINWKYKYGIILIVVSIVIFSLHMTLFHNSEEVYSYFLLHLGFIPIDVLLVALVLEEIVSRKEKEAIYEKLDMIMGAFFFELGDDLLFLISSIDNQDQAINKLLKNIGSWDIKDYNIALKAMKKSGADFNGDLDSVEGKQFLYNLRECLHGKRDFLIDLIENPNLLEKDNFSSLLLAIFHLTQELELRGQLDTLPTSDYNHLVGDINRVYTALMIEWVNYLRYLKSHYPYMISIAIRTNPFNTNSNIVIDEVV